MKKNSAFSLIEISITLLIIGILVAGVTQSSRLVKQFRLKNAQTLTQSSPVHGIKDLVTWFETSTEASFLDSESQNNLLVSTWYDINTQVMTKNNASQATATNKPKYVEDVINGLPVIRFDGADNFMTFDGTILSDTNYTIFAVEQRRANNSLNHFVGGSTGSQDNNLHLGYDSDTALRFGQYDDDVDYTVPAYGSPIPRIHTFRFSKSTGKSYWSNGGSTADASSSSTSYLYSNAGAALGRAVFGDPYYFNGDIAELIIFIRALKVEERQAIEVYLSKKYNITIS